jgi:hypothetical protein
MIQSFKNTYRFKNTDVFNIYAVFRDNKYMVTVSYHWNHQQTREIVFTASKEVLTLAIDMIETYYNQYQGDSTLKQETSFALFNLIRLLA